MRAEVNTKGIKLIPETQADCYNIGIISTKISCRVSFIVTDKSVKCVEIGIDSLVKGLVCSLSKPE